MYVDSVYSVCDRGESSVVGGYRVGLRLSKAGVSAALKHSKAAKQISQPIECQVLHVSNLNDLSVGYADI